MRVLVARDSGRKAWLDRVSEDWAGSKIRQSEAAGKGWHDESTRGTCAGWSNTVGEIFFFGSVGLQNAGRPTEVSSWGRLR